MNVAIHVPELLKKKSNTTNFSNLHICSFTLQLNDPKQVEGFGKYYYFIY